MRNLQQLPDEVLVRILSFLTVNDAARTCVLSRRWRNLSKFITCLNFVPRKTYKCPVKSNLLNTPWVDRVLKSHECSFLDEFRVKFALCAYFCCKVDEWIIKYLIPKRAKCVEINMSEYTPIDKPCDFFTSLSKLSNINGLTSLTLKGSSVDGKLLEYLLSNCPHLEFLSASESRNLLNLKVAGPSLQLKHLEISGCKRIQRIEVSAPKLLTLKYSGKRTEFHVGENPNLSRLIFGGEDEAELSYVLGPFLSHLLQLETLKLKMYKHQEKGIPRFLELMELRNLKHLILDIAVHSCYDSLIGLTSIMLAAAPSLKMITFNLSLYYGTFTKHRPSEPQLYQPHQRLKKVEIRGFFGGYPEFELAKYLLKNAVDLDKMVIDPFRPCGFKHEKRIETKNTETRRKHALGLKKFLPPAAELVVL